MVKLEAYIFIQMMLRFMYPSYFSRDFCILFERHIYRDERETEKEIKKKNYSSSCLLLKWPQ